MDENGVAANIIPIATTFCRVTDSLLVMSVFVPAAVYFAVCCIVVIVVFIFS